MTAEDRGFYFAVFQSDASRDIVKAWLDGSEDYTLFSHKEFIELAFDIEPTIIRALRDYSYFLWDTRQKTVSRLRFQQDPEAIRKLINAHQSSTAEDSDPNAEISEKYFRTDSKIVADKVSIKV